jgi:anhydro-N-acetylmuramic acid kinase
VTVLVGLMSGTSLDGVSAAVVRFMEKEGVISPELLAFVSRPYSAAQRTELEARLIGGSAREFARFDFDLGVWLADAAVAVIAEAGVARSDVAAIASHGHTVWHDPPHSTLQMGNAAVIAERTGVTVISDFRSRDLAAGGQGAPLVTIADAMMFSSPTKWRATLNLGGIANVQLIPPGGELKSVRAFDTGPGVGVLDATVRMLEPNLPYDVGGALARRGTAVTRVVDGLLKASYFITPPPKSTGRELFSPTFAQQLIDRCRAESPACSSQDIVATATSFTARSIALSFEKFIPEPVEEVLVSGGGAKNPALFDAIRAELERTARAMHSRVPSVVPFESVYFDGEAKEAVAFAFLGWLHLQGRPGNVPGATGATGPRILGSFTPA